jgi:hypothetical protein
MTATDLSKLADLLEEDSIPNWLRDQIEHRTTEIQNTLKSGQSVHLSGPHGERLTIGPISQANPVHAV